MSILNTRCVIVVHSRKHPHKAGSNIINYVTHRNIYMCDMTSVFDWLSAVPPIKQSITQKHFVYRHAWSFHSLCVAKPPKYLSLYSIYIVRTQFPIYIYIYNKGARAFVVVQTQRTCLARITISENKIYKLHVLCSSRARTYVSATWWHMLWSNINLIHARFLGLSKSSIIAMWNVCVMNVLHEMGMRYYKALCIYNKTWFQWQIAISVFSIFRRPLAITI